MKKKLIMLTVCALFIANAQAGIWKDFTNWFSSLFGKGKSTDIISVETEKAEATAPVEEIAVGFEDDTTVAKKGATDTAVEKEESTSDNNTTDLIPAPVETEKTEIEAPVEFTTNGSTANGEAVAKEELSPVEEIAVGFEDDATAAKEDISDLIPPVETEKTETTASVEEVTIDTALGSNNVDEDLTS